MYAVSYPRLHEANSKETRKTRNNLHLCPSPPKKKTKSLRRGSGAWSPRLFIQEVFSLPGFMWPAFPSLGPIFTEFQSFQSEKKSRHMELLLGKDAQSHAGILWEVKIHSSVSHVILVVVRWGCGTPTSYERGFGGPL